MNDQHKPGICEDCATVDGYRLVKRAPETISLHGIAFEVTDLQWYECFNCGDVINTPAVLKVNSQRIEAAYAAKRERVRKEKNLLGADCIRTIRTKLNVTQEALSIFLGVGENGLQKYETGKTCPSKPVDLLLRLIGKFPALLDVIKQVSDIPASDFARMTDAKSVAKQSWQSHVVVHTLGTLDAYTTPSNVLDQAIFNGFTVCLDINAQSHSMIQGGIYSLPNEYKVAAVCSIGEKKSFSRESTEVEAQTLNHLYRLGEENAVCH